MAKEIVPGLYRISRPNIHCFLLVADEVVLIDTNVPKMWPSISRALSAAGKKPEDVDHIAITHSHLDHVGSVAAAAAATDAPVYAHPQEAQLIRAGKMASVRPIGVGKILLPAFYTFTPKQFESTTVDNLVGDGDDVAGLQVIATPGHTAGHVSYLWPEHGGVLFVGDALCNNMRIDFGFSCEDSILAKASAKKLAELDFEVAVFGHGSPIKENAAEKVRKAVDRLVG
jgi:glyoxylase-like metal-dependent hydrolase (beta-lactamase superfamily II)